MKRQTFNTSLDPKIIEKLKQASFEEFGTDRKANQIIERALREEFKMTTTELRTNDSGDVWAVQLDAEGNIIGVSEALHYDDHAEAAKGNVEFRAEPEDVEWAEAHLTRQYVG
jgi:hypothetical protein